MSVPTWLFSPACAPYILIRNASKTHSFLVEDDLRVEQTIGTGNGVLLTWSYDPNMTCDYVIKWCNASQPQPCLMDWKKVPAHSTEALIQSGACSQGSPGAGSGSSRWGGWGGAGTGLPPCWAGVGRPAFPEGALGHVCVRGSRSLDLGILF